MQLSLESMIKEVFAKWKRRHQPKNGHLEAEVMAGLIDGLLSEKENELALQHLAVCNECAESFSFILKGQESQIKEVPEASLNKAKEILSLQEKPSVLEVILRFKKNIFEIIKINGDILLGQELVPAAVLRSRNIMNLKDEMVILKDFKDIRLELKIENKENKSFNITVQVKHKRGIDFIKDLRITLSKDSVELESYLSESGSVNFEHVPLGKYHVEVAGSGEKLASILIDMNT